MNIKKIMANILSLASNNAPLRFWYRSDIEPRNIRNYFINEKYLNVRSEKGYYIKFLIDKIRKI